MTNRDSFDSPNAFATDHVVSMSYTPPWSRLQKHACKKRYKTMSLDVWRKAVIAATESDVKEGGYSLRMNKSNKEQITIDQLKELGTYHKFKTIYGDPPWSKHQKGKLGAIQHYDLMTLEQIKQMPIGHLAADDALLFLWVTPGLMKEGIEVIESWGFRYVDEMVWDKYYLGLGQRLRHTHEPLLLGVKGKPPILCRNQASLVRAVRQDHSHKPEEFFPIIERMSEAPCLELFSRRQPTTYCRDNWSVWGNEIESDIYIPGYPVPKYSSKATLPKEAEEDV